MEKSYLNLFYVAVASVYRYTYMYVDELMEPNTKSWVGFEELFSSGL